MQLYDIIAIAKNLKDQSPQYNLSLDQDFRSQHSNYNTSNNRKSPLI